MPKTSTSALTVPEVSLRLVRDKEVPYDGFTIRKADAVARFLHERDVESLDREHLFVFSLNSRNRLQGFTVASIGTADATVIHPREVFKTAILQNASSVIVAHNHPSGDPCPSDEDIAVTTRLIEAGRILGIPVLDHVVVGSSGSFVSIRESMPGYFG